MKLLGWPSKEEDIHSCIVEAFENQDYSCENFHDSGAAWENGIDILAYKSKEKIALAVKISPQKKDLKQLMKLAGTKAKRKIYVYVGDATAPFFKELGRLSKKSNLEVMKEDSLRKFLLENQSLEYVKRYLFDSDTFRNLVDILHIWKSENGGKHARPDKGDLDLLWKWKDKQVSFHKVCRTSHHFMGHKINNIESEKKVTYPILVEESKKIVDYLNLEMEELKSVFEKVEEKNSGLLALIWPICSARSGWFTLLNHIGRTKDKQEIGEILFNWYFRHILTSPYALLTHFFDKLEEMAGDMELIIDWLFDKRKLK